MPTTFLNGPLAGLGSLYVEVAWGANLAADPATWVWTDITTDVLVNDGRRIDISIGRGDEAAVSQPADCSLRLKNISGAYSLGAQSSNYPNVRRNTPVRVRIDDGPGDPVVTFQGYATGWTPKWDVTGGYAVVELSASGVLRRLQQGDSPVISALRRAYTTAAAPPLAYWPAEDGKDALGVASGFDGQPAMDVLGSPDLQASTAFASSAALPKLNNSSWFGNVPSGGTPTGEVQLRFLASFPGSGLGVTGTAVLARLFTSGTISWWDLVYHEDAFGGSMSLFAYDKFANLLLNTGAVDFNLDGTDSLLSIDLAQSGADVNTMITRLSVGEPSGAVWPSTITGQTLGQATRVIIGPTGDISSLAVGHITVSNDIAAVAANFNELNAFAGETATARITRLCDENDVPVTLVGSSSIAMGPQSADTLVNLLRECETADQGILFDGLGPGVTYVARESRENASAALTVDAAAGQLAGDFSPVDDDQRNRNKVTATRTRGGSYTYTDASGPLGTAAIGTYDESIEVNAASDRDLPSYAGWLVHLGTVAGYRYPNLPLDLAKEPALIPGWMAMQPGSRLDVTNITDVRTQHPTGTISSILEGYTLSLDKFRWDVVANCSPSAPWRIGIIAATTGDTNPLLLRMDTDSSTLAAAIAAGATSMSVSTTSGPRWTTLADDFPFDVDVAGMRVTVTNITGAGSPQTFTVTAATVTAARPLGATVKLWDPPVIGL